MWGGEDELANELCHASVRPEWTDTNGSYPKDPFLTRDFSLSDYEPKFARIRGHLERGESYQLCFTYPLQRVFDGDPLRLFEILRAQNPAPFAAYLEGDGTHIVSSSPERFVQADTAGKIMARPMKGTAPRVQDRQRDQQAKERLRRSRKDRAENLMIADLLRNDVGRVARIGTAKVTDPAVIEEYATVFQMVSQVEAELDPHRTRAELMASVFPPGSMTGAPKARSIEILRQLETRRRGPYSGVLGYWSIDGRLDFSVLIRCWVIREGQAGCGVGGGVVWDSTASGEFAESRLKAEAMLRALNQAQADSGSGIGV